MDTPDGTADTGPLWDRGARPDGEAGPGPGAYLGSRYLETMASAVSTSG